VGRTPDELSPTEAVILGLLGFAELEGEQGMSGYDLLRAFGRSPGMMWAPTKGHMYAILPRLVSQGWATSREVVQAKRPTKQLYRITRKGRAALRTWLAAPAEAGQERDMLLVKIFFGDLGDRDAILGHIARRREEAEALLERRSGDADNPRILGAFNERTPDWLSFFMFTFFTDRDGKFQLSALTESAFDPLARTTRFMLTEEGHHMFVGRNGIRRIIERTADIMVRERTDNPERLRALGVIDLPTMQRYLNFHSSVTADLFGADLSSNAATFYTTGLKGRYLENRIADDHVLTAATYPILNARSGDLVREDAPALNALNERLRDDFINDSVSGVEAWNTSLQKRGIDFRFSVPHKGFNRRIGSLAGAKVSPEGKVLSEDAWNARARDWLPTPEDRAYVQSLMGRVVEPGKFANWIAPPSGGINGQPVDCEYVRFN